MSQFHPFQAFLLHAESAAAAVLPSLVTAPELSGEPRVGEELSCTDGVYTGTEPITVGSYQWQISADGSTGWADIDGATDANYTLVVGDYDNYVRRGEVASNSVGSADRAYSDASDRVWTYADITFVGAGSVASGMNAISLGFPAGHQADDYALMLIETAGVQVATPDGWGLVGYLEDLAGASDTAITVFERVATSSAEAATVPADSGDHQIGVIAVYRGVASRLAEVGEAQNLANALSCSLASITTTTPKTRVVYLAGSNGANGAMYSAWTSENLSDIQERADATTTLGDDGVIGIADGSMAAAGAVGAGSVTQAYSQRTNILTVGLVPAVV